MKLFRKVNWIEWQPIGCERIITIGSDDTRVLWRHKETGELITSRLKGSWTTSEIIGASR